MTGVAAVAEEDRRPPRSREEIALSFAPVVREAAPAVVKVFSRNQLPAARLGLRRRDVVVAVGDREVESVGQLRKVLSRPHAAWSLVIDRDGQRLATVIGG